MKQQLPAVGVGFGRVQSFLLTLAVLGFLAAPALIQIGGLTTDPSFLDNRPPARFPGLPTSIARLEEFRNALIRYVDDNFGLRAELVKANVIINSWIGVSSIPNLMIGKDGWFFLKTYENILDQFRGLDRFTPKDLDNWIDTMERYQRWLNDRGIAFMIVIAPNQQTIYPDYMPGYANRVWPETRLDQLTRRLRERKSGLTLVDPRDDLWSARRNGQLYHKYESHWNNLGAFVGYSSIMHKVEPLFPQVKTLQMSDFNLKEVYRYWDIPPSKEEETIFALKYPSAITSSKLVSKVENLEVNETDTTYGNAPNLLLYGDSFGIGLYQYLRETFKTTVYAHFSQILSFKKMVNIHHPDIVIYELVERYLRHPQADNRDLESELLVRHAPTLAAALAAGETSTGGYIDGFSIGANSVRFTGWAIGPVSQLSAKIVYAYYGDHAVAATVPADPRPGLKRGTAGQTAGFALSLDLPSDIRSPEHPLRFFSVDPSGKIYPLTIYPPVLSRIRDLFHVEVRN